MRIAVSATGTGLEGEASRTFGRCPRYVFLDTETMKWETLENPAVAASGGAGIQAAEFVIRNGAKAVVTGSVGPNASRVLEAAGVSVYLLQNGTVHEAVLAFRAESLPSAPVAAGPVRRGRAECREPEASEVHEGHRGGRILPGREE